MLFCRTKLSNFLVTDYFYGGIIVCAYPIFCLLCSCSLLFFTAPHNFSPCSLLTASISHCLTAALNFHVFLPRKFVSFVFNHSFWLFLCYPHEWKRQKQHRKRYNFVVVFSFLKSGRPCDCYPNKTLSCISVAIPFD